MRTFSGRDGRVYLAGSPVPFAAVPLADCGDGFNWRCADETLRCWADGAFTFEARAGGEWEAVEPLEVRHSSASVNFGRCLSGSLVRASGFALPTSLLATGERWTLRQVVIEGKTLMGPEVALGTTSALLEDVSETGWAPVSAFGRVLAVLPSAAVGAFVGLGELVREASCLKVTFDQTGVSYGTG